MKRTVEVNGKQIYYDCPNAATSWRAQTLFTKEPDTIEWINGFKPGETLMDIGANVGMYTIYAAGICGIEVVAFEPEAGNFALLLSNIRLNRLDDLVTAYPVSMTDKSGFDTFYLSTLGVGGAGHTFGEPLDQHLQPRNSSGKQGMYATSVDDFSLAEKCYPDHIKIDVDALEHRIIEGAGWLLRQTNRPKSVLCELNTNVPEHMDVVVRMKDMGFKCTVAPGAIRTKGGAIGVGNHIFTRTKDD